MKLNPKNILFGNDTEKKPVLLAVTPPRTGERTLLGVENLLQSIAVPEPFSLELAGDMDGVMLMARCLDDQVVRGQLSAHYPQARIQKVEPDDDPLRLDEGEQAWSITLRADGPEYVPLRTFRDDDLLDPGSDPLIALMGALSALHERERVVTRLLLRSLGPDWSQPHMEKAHKRPGMEPREPSYTYQTKPLQMDGVTMAVLGIGALAALKGYLWVQDGEIWKAALLGAGTVLGLAAGGWAWWRWKKARKRVEDPLLIKEKVSRIAFDAELQVVAVLSSDAEPQRARELLGTVSAAYRHYDNPAGARFKVGRVRPAVPDPEMLHPAGPGLFGRRSVLGVREAACLWHPPGAGDETPLVERSGARALSPSARGVRGGALVGDTTGGAKREIRFPADLLRRHHRSIPLDAAMTLPDGRTVGIVRQGLTADRSGFSGRLRRLLSGPIPGTLLVLMADDVRLRHARRVLSNIDVPALLAVEREVVRAGADDKIWTPSEISADIDLRYELERAAPGGGLPREPEPGRADAPADVAVEGPGWDIPDHMLPVTLSSAEKRALDLISDWPWTALGELAGLMGVTPQRASQIVIPLEGFGLAARHRDRDGRLALTDRGLALRARRDRTSVVLARRRWSIAPQDPEAPFEWRNLSGGRSRQLLRNIEHTAAVHGFLAALTAQARLLGWQVVQLDPPRRASRHFRHDDRARAVNPDALGVLRRDETTWPFFLEWERRAVRPSTMSERLAPYLRYYSSHRPTDAHGARPSVLVVFDDDIAATHFLRVARELMREAVGTLPLWVSHREAIDALGPLGRAWRAPADPVSPQALPPQ